MPKLRTLVLRCDAGTGHIDDAYIALSGGMHQSAKLGEAIKQFNRSLEISNHEPIDTGAVTLAGYEFDVLVARLLQSDPFNEAEYPKSSITLVAATIDTDSSSENTQKIYRYFYCPIEEVKR